MANSNVLVAKTIYDLYKNSGLSIDSRDPSKMGFAILNLKEVNFELPYESPVYRPDFYSFLFVKDGIGHYSIDGQSFESKPGTIYFTNPSNYRTFGWSNIEEVYLICFDEDFLKLYVNDNVFESYPFLLTELINPKVVDAQFYAKVEAIYLLIFQEFAQKENSSYEIIGHFLGALLFRIKAYFWKDYDPIQEGNRSSKIVKSFKENLEKHYRDLINDEAEHLFQVQDYAKLLNLHPNYLGNVIKSMTGKSVSTWINDKTTTIAKSLLIRSNLSIKEISYKLRFSEPSYFSNYFKKETGMTANSFRKSVQ